MVVPALAAREPTPPGPSAGSARAGRRARREAGRPGPPRRSTRAGPRAAPRHPGPSARARRATPAWHRPTSAADEPRTHHSVVRAALPPTPQFAPGSAPPSPSPAPQLAPPRAPRAPRDVRRLRLPEPAQDSKPTTRHTVAFEMQRLRVYVIRAPARCCSSGLPAVHRCTPHPRVPLCARALVLSQRRRSGTPGGSGCGHCERSWFGERSGLGLASQLPAAVEMADRSVSRS